MFGAGVTLTRAHGKALSSFQYKGEDRSILYNLCLSDLAAWLVDHATPTWMAPNLITLLGLCAPVLTLLVALYYQPLMGLGMPNWVALLCALAMFTYSTLDNMDGKQARKTGSSSALGLLFDHGLDAINAGLVNWANIALIVGVPHPGSWQTLLWFVIPVVPFFFASWEEKFTGEFILPIINGPNEGICLCVSLMVLQFLYGQEAVWAWPVEPTAPGTSLLVRAALWVAAPVIDLGRWLEGGGSAPIILGAGAAAAGGGGGSSSISTGSYLAAWLECAGKGFVFPGGVGSSSSSSSPTPTASGTATSQEVISTLVFTIGSLTAAAQVVGVCRLLVVVQGKGWRGVGSALGVMVPFLAILGGLGAWIFTPGLPKDLTRGPGWVAVYGTAGALIVEDVIRIMMSFVCKDDGLLSGVGFVVGRVGVYAALPWALSSSGGGGRGWLEAPLRALGGVTGYGEAMLLESALLAAATFNAFLVATFLHSAFSQCAQALDIDVFSIQRQVERGRVGGGGGGGKGKGGRGSTPTHAAAAAATDAAATSEEGGVGVKGGAGALPAAKKRGGSARARRK